MRRVFSVLLSLGVASSLFAAGASQVATAPIEREIVLASPRDIVPGAQDFFFASSIVQVWEPLIAVDDQWRPAPGLAQRWQMSEDGTEWTLHLRRGVRFHDGEPFNADAVLANFRRYAAVNPGQSRFYSFSLARFYPGFESIEKVDEYTVRLSFDRPSPAILYSMTSFGSPMFSPNSFDDTTWAFVGIPAATGPFQIVEQVSDQFSILERFDDYWGEPAQAHRIRIRVIPEATTRASALRAGEIMGVLDLGAMPPVLARQLLRDDRFGYSKAPNSIIHYLSLNATVFPFNDVRMRRAISLALDRRLIADQFYGGFVSPAAHLLNHSSPFYVSMDPEHDPAEARRLAREVLGSRRHTTTFIVPAPFTQRYPYTEKAEYAQSVLADLGIDVEIRIIEWGAYREAQRTGNYGVGMQIQGLPNGEPLSIFTSFMRSTGGQNRDMSLGFNSPEADRLIAEAERELDMSRRAELYAALLRLAATEFPVVPIINDVNLLVYNREITGFGAKVYGVTLSSTRWR